MKQQPKKDSNQKRVNFDNTRESKFIKDVDKRLEENGDTKRFRNGHNHKFKSTKTDKRKTGRTNTGARSNDVSWYSKNPELVKAAGSIPFASILGKPTFRSFKMNGSTKQNQYSAVPGALIFRYQPMYTSITPSFNDADKQAFASMYSFLVHANSRNYTYEPADLEVLTLAGIEVFAALANAIRAFGIVHKYREDNAYFPRRIIGALGFQYDDLLKNLSKMWFDINVLIDRTKQIWIPTTLPLLARRIWMNSTLFKDEDSNLSQIYAYAQARYYIYDATGATNGGALKKAYYSEVRGTYAQWKFFDLTEDSYLTWEDYYDMVTRMIDALVQDEDRGVIYGDILKAYGSDKIFAMARLDVNYTTEESYNPEVLTQFENLTVTPNVNILGWIQNSGSGLQPIMTKSMIYKGEAWVSKLAAGKCYPQTTVLNYHQKQQPTPEQNMVASRCITSGLGLNRNCKFYADNYTPGPDQKFKDANMSAETNAYVPLAHGTEIVVDAIVATNAFSENWDHLKYIAFDATSYSLEQMQMMTWIRAFDWAPAVYIQYGSELTNQGNALETQAGLVVDAAMEFDNYTIIEPAVVEKMHTVAFYSLYGVPQV